MNIIVTNKYKDLIYNTGIEVLKEMNGVFTVSQIANGFGSIFYKKIIIDATALENFPKDTVLKELASSFDLDKLILFLPPDNPAPKNFLSFLVSLNIYNFTDNATGLIELVKKSNTIDNVANFKEEKVEKIEPSENINYNNFDEKIGRIILGIRNITDDYYGVKLTYMLKKTLESTYSKNVLALEIDKKDLIYYNDKNMYSLKSNQVNNFLNNNFNCDIMIINLNDDQEIKCDDEIYLVNPSLYYINRLMYKDRSAFTNLKGKKVIFVDSLLTDRDVEQFAKEAGISIYYNLKPLNDRVNNDEINKLLIKLGIVEEINNKPTKKGLFDIFK